MTAEQNHPITPPHELVEKWYKEWLNCRYIGLEGYIATQAARWGADQELEACRLWVSEVHSIYDAAELLNQRRPKPPSLKEQALQAMCRFMDSDGHDGLTPEEVSEDFCLIRRALEQLND